MARIVIVSQWLLGHMVPILGVGTELNNRGHEILVLAPHSFRSLIEEAGLTYTEVSSGRYPHKFMAEALAEMNSVLERIKPDVVVCDSALSVPAYVAEKMGIPWVSYQTSAYIPDQHIPGVKAVNDRMRALYEQELNTLRESYGLSPLVDSQRTRGDLAGISPILHLLLFIDKWIPDAWQLPAQSKIVGPCAYIPKPDVPIVLPTSSSECPRIVVCTSSADKPGYDKLTDHYVDSTVQAFSNEEVSLMILGHSSKSGQSRAAPNIHWLTDHLNHHLIFLHTDLIITHGGCGTLQKAILHGVPMIIIPLGLDHEWVAARCAELGIARVLKPSSIDAVSISRVARQILQDQDMMGRVKRLSAELKDMNSEGQSADAIEKVLRD